MAPDDGTFRDRYPGPWTVELAHSDTFVVTSANGYRLVYVHFRDAPLEWRMGPIWRLSLAEGRALALAIAGLGKRRRRRDNPNQFELPL